MSCTGCSPSRVNGVLVHEAGCPEAWRTEIRECKWCGSDYTPIDRISSFCSEGCWRAYHNVPEPETTDV